MSQCENCDEAQKAWNKLVDTIHEWGKSREPKIDPLDIYMRKDESLYIDIPRRFGMEQYGITWEDVMRLRCSIDELLRIPRCSECGVMLKDGFRACTGCEEDLPETVQVIRDGVGKLP
jgi:hypothetical protein